MIDWSPSLKTVKLLRNVCFACWLACLVAASRYFGARESSQPGFEMLLFLGVFPVFFGAILILKKRVAGSAVTNWVPILFRGLPRGFGVFYRAYFTAVWLLGMYLMLLPMFRLSALPDFGVNAQVVFALLPSVFYLTSAGAYWSAALEAAGAR